MFVGILPHIISEHISDEFFSALNSVISHEHYYFSQLLHVQPLQDYQDDQRDQWSQTRSRLNAL